MIRFVFRWLFRLLLLGLALLVALFLLKDALLREFAVWRVRRATGLETRLGRAELGLFTGTVTLEDLRLYNPAEFGGGPLLVLHELHAEADPEAAAAGRAGLRLLRVRLGEVNLVRNAAGQTNVAELLGGVAQVAQRPATNRWEVAGRDLAGIRTLNLSLGTVRYTDLAQPANSWAFNLGVTNEVVANVRTEADLAPLAARLLVRWAWQALNAPRTNAPPAAVPGPR
jgi:uncharacterized protein involved in outer membrane biogenesis